MDLRNTHDHLMDDFRLKRKSSPYPCCEKSLPTTTVDHWMATLRQLDSTSQCESEQPAAATTSPPSTPVASGDSSRGDANSLDTCEVSSTQTYEERTFSVPTTEASDGRAISHQQHSSDGKQLVLISDDTQSKESNVVNSTQIVSKRTPYQIHSKNNEIDVNRLCIESGECRSRLATSKCNIESSVSHSCKESDCDDIGKSNDLILVNSSSEKVIKTRNRNYEEPPGNRSLEEGTPKLRRKKTSQPRFSTQFSGSASSNEKQYCNKFIKINSESKNINIDTINTKSTITKIRSNSTNDTTITHSSHTSCSIEGSGTKSLNSNNLSDNLRQVSSNNLTNFNSLSYSRGRPGRLDAKTRECWKRIRSLSRDSKIKQEHREEQQHLAEVEEHQRRARILAQRKQERDDITDRFLRQPLQWYTKRRSSHSPKSFKGDSGCFIRESKSVPDLDEALRIVRGDYGVAEPNIPLHSNKKNIYRYDGRFDSKKVLPSSQQNSIYTCVNPPGRTIDGRIFRLCYGAKNYLDNEPQNFPTSGVKSIIRENQKPYPTRSPKELIDIKNRRNQTSSSIFSTMGTVKALEESFRVTDAVNLNEDQSWVEYLPIYDSRVLLVDKPKICRRRSLPDLTNFNCVSSTVAYEAVSTLANHNEACNFIIVPNSQSHLNYLNVTNGNTCLRANQSDQFQSEYLEQKWNKQLGGVLQRDTEQMFQSSPLIKNPAANNSINNKSIKELKSERQEWITKQSSLSEMKKNIFSTEKVDIAVQTDQNNRPWSRQKSNSIRGEESETFYYDSLEEDETIEPKVSGENEAFFISIDGVRDDANKVHVELPPHLSARINDLRNKKVRKKTQQLIYEIATEGNNNKDRNYISKAAHQVVNELITLSSDDTLVFSSSTKGCLPPVQDTSSRQGSAKRANCFNQTENKISTHLESLPVIPCTSQHSSRSNEQGKNAGNLTSVGDVFTLGITNENHGNDNKCSNKLSNITNSTFSISLNETISKDATYTITSDVASESSLDVLSSLSNDEEEKETSQQIFGSENDCTDQLITTNDNEAVVFSSDRNKIKKMYDDYTESDSDEELIVEKREEKLNELGLILTESPNFEERIKQEQKLSGSVMHDDINKQQYICKSESTDLSIHESVKISKLAGHSTVKRWLNEVKNTTERNSSEILNMKEDGFDLETDDVSVCTESSDKITVIAAGRSSSSGRSLDTDSPNGEDVVEQETADNEESRSNFNESPNGELQIKSSSSRALHNTTSEQLHNSLCDTDNDCNNDNPKNIFSIDTSTVSENSSNENNKSFNSFNNKIAGKTSHCDHFSAGDLLSEIKIKPICSEQQNFQLETKGRSNKQEPNYDELSDDVPDVIIHDGFIGLDGSVTSTDDSACSLLSTIEEEAETSYSARSSNTISDRSRTLEQMTFESEEKNIEDTLLHDNEITFFSDQNANCENNSENISRTNDESTVDKASTYNSSHSNNGKEHKQLYPTDAESHGHSDVKSFHVTNKDQSIEPIVNSNYENDSFTSANEHWNEPLSCIATGNTVNNGASLETNFTDDDQSGHENNINNVKRSIDSENCDLAYDVSHQNHCQEKVINCLQGDNNNGLPIQSYNTHDNESTTVEIADENSNNMTSVGNNSQNDDVYQNNINDNNDFTSDIEEELVSGASIEEELVSEIADNSEAEKMASESLLEVSIQYDNDFISGNINELFIGDSDDADHSQNYEITEISNQMISDISAKVNSEVIDDIDSNKLALKEYSEDKEVELINDITNDSGNSAYTQKINTCSTEHIIVTSDYVYNFEENHEDDSIRDYSHDTVNRTVLVNEITRECSGITAQVNDIEPTNEAGDAVYTNNKNADMNIILHTEDELTISQNIEVHDKGNFELTYSDICTAVTDKPETDIVDDNSTTMPKHTITMGISTGKNIIQSAEIAEEIESSSNVNQVTEITNNEIKLRGRENLIPFVRSNAIENIAFDCQESELPSSGENCDISHMKENEDELFVSDGNEESIEIDVKKLCLSEQVRNSDANAVNQKCFGAREEEFPFLEAVRVHFGHESLSTTEITGEEVVNNIPESNLSKDDTPEQLNGNETESNSNFSSDNLSELGSSTEYDVTEDLTADDTPIDVDFDEVIDYLRKVPHFTKSCRNKNKKINKVSFQDPEYILPNDELGANDNYTTEKSSQNKSESQIDHNVSVLGVEDLAVDEENTYENYESDDVTKNIESLRSYADMSISVIENEVHEPQNQLPELDSVKTHIHEQQETEPVSSDRSSSYSPLPEVSHVMKIHNDVTYSSDIVSERGIENHSSTIPDIIQEVSCIQLSPTNAEMTIEASLDTYEPDHKNSFDPDENDADIPGNQAERTMMFTSPTSPISNVQGATNNSDDSSARSSQDLGQPSTTSPSTDSGVVEMPCVVEECGGNCKDLLVSSSAENTLTNRTNSTNYSRPVSSIGSRISTPETRKIDSRPHSSKQLKDEINRIKSGHRSTFKWVQSTLQNDIVEDNSDEPIEDDVIYRVENTYYKSRTEIEDDHPARKLWEPCNPEALNALPSPAGSNLTSASQSPINQFENAESKMQRIFVSRDDDSENENVEEHAKLSAKILKTLESRRVRRHRNRASSIDSPARQYKPASLSSLDHLLASLPRYQSINEFDYGQDSSTSTRRKTNHTNKFQSGNGSGEVTVQVIAGKQHPDVKVTASRQVNLLVQVGVQNDTNVVDIPQSSYNRPPFVRGYTEGQQSERHQLKTQQQHTVTNQAARRLLRSRLGEMKCHQRLSSEDRKDTRNSKQSLPDHRFDLKDDLEGINRPIKKYFPDHEHTSKVTNSRNNFGNRNTETVDHNLEKISIKESKPRVVQNKRDLHSQPQAFNSNVNTTECFYSNKNINNKKYKLNDLSKISRSKSVEVNDRNRLTNFKIQNERSKIVTDRASSAMSMRVMSAESGTVRSSSAQSFYDVSSMKSLSDRTMSAKSFNSGMSYTEELENTACRMSPREQVDLMLSNLKNYCSRKLKPTRRQFLRSPLKADRMHSANTVNQEQATSDILIKGNNVQKCFSSPTPEEVRTLLKPQVRSCSRERRPSRDAQQLEHQRLQRNIAAINALLSSLN